MRESLSGRRREAERAEAIVEHEAERFRDWQASLHVVPAIASLRERAESIRSGELAKAEGRLEGLSESERRTVESLTTQIVNKLLHVPIVRMKEAAATEGAGYVEVARRPVRPARTRMLVRVGSRGSRLALTQAELAADALRGPGIEIALVPITTAGDRDRTKPFGEIGERGVFVKELEEALLDGRIDVAVHSAKDMTSTDADGLVVGAYLRARIRGTRSAARPGSSPGCGSERRRCGGGRSCSRSSRRSRSSRCAGTSTRGCASAASAAWTQSCSRRAASTGSASPPRSGTASTRT